MRKRRRTWTEKEDNFLKLNYPILGAKLCGKRLKVDSCCIYNRLRKLKLKKPDTRIWTQKQLDLLREHYPKMGSICYSLVNKTKSAVLGMAAKLKIKSNKDWTKKEINHLKEYYPTQGSKCGLAIHKSRCATVAMACRLKIKKNTVIHDPIIKFASIVKKKKNYLVFMANLLLQNIRIANRVLK